MIEVLAANWLWIAAIVFFVAMHRGGHGCGMHGGHAGHSGQQHTDRTDHADHADHADHTDQAEPAKRTGTDRSAT